MTYAKVYFVLTALLLLTVGLAYLPLGEAAKPISLLIAAVKIGFVMYYFMELREAQPLVRLVAFVGLFFVLILFSLTYTDFLSRGMAGVLGK